MSDNEWFNLKTSEFSPELKALYDRKIELGRQASEARKAFEAELQASYIGELPDGKALVVSYKPQWGSLGFKIGDSRETFTKVAKPRTSLAEWRRSQGLDGYDA